ncbi:hypothetical protein BOW55_07795 [Flavobacterium sp. YO12]|nr:hypothetical protein BOW55_07795 [Flavobacterium sp. YO12]
MNFAGSNPALPTERGKEVKRSLFQSFQKPEKTVVKPANPRIRRFFSFILLFKFFKTAQNLCGKIVAKIHNESFATEFKTIPYKHRG